MARAKEVRACRWEQAVQLAPRKEHQHQRYDEQYGRLPADGHHAELVVRDLDFALLEEVRKRWAFYRDRRPDAYGALVED